MVRTYMCTYSSALYHGIAIPWYSYHGTYYHLVLKSHPNFLHTCARRTMCILEDTRQPVERGNTHLHSRYRPHTSASTARSTAGIATTMSASMYTCTYHVNVYVYARTDGRTMVRTQWYVPIGSMVQHGYTCTIRPMVLTGYHYW